MLSKRCPRALCDGKLPVKRHGFFITKWNHQPVRRYFCGACRRSFSSHTTRPTFGQLKPYLNAPISRLYASTMTQRRMALVLGTNRKTVVRKFLLMARLAKQAHETWLEAQRPTRVQFDEMETFEHTRLKPLSLALCVDETSRKILGASVATMPYRGKLAGLAFRKYGPRADQRPNVRRDILRKFTRLTNLTIVTDHHPAYPRAIQSVLPQAIHIPASLPAQKRFRAEGYRRNVDDPLLAINHTAARLRHDLSRLLRKVWVTTKKRERLQAHLDLYLAYFNQLSLPQ